jgi:hypothetical protein
LLEETSRPLHHAEIGLLLLERQVADAFSWHRLSSDLAGDPTTFATDGYGLWQLRDKLGDTVEDRRPDHPEIPTAVSADMLEYDLGQLEASKHHTGEPLFERLSPLAPEFPGLASAKIAEALQRLSGEGRRSVGEVLKHASDFEVLLSWLRSGVFAVTAEFDDGMHLPLRQSALHGLAVIAAIVASMHAGGISELGPWEALKRVCGKEIRHTLFDTNGAPREFVHWELLTAAHQFNLRHCFDFHCDVWFCLLGLQAGILRGDLRTLPHWLSSQIAPVAIRHLVAPGLNHSRPMACLWNALLLFRRGSVGRAAIEQVSSCSIWWPSWTVDDACGAASEPTPRPDGTGPKEPDGTPLYPVTPKARVRAIPAGRVGLPISADSPGDPAKPLGEPDIWFDFTRKSFVMELPQRLPLSPGPVRLRTNDFVVGGRVSADGPVAWHSTDNSFRFPIRGPDKREVVVEGGSKHLVSQAIRLWDAGEYLTLFNIATPKPRPLDPFLVPLRGSGPVALLMHDSLQASLDADQSWRLHGDFVLRLYERGIPEGTTISVQDEVVWTAEPDSSGDQQFVAEEEALLEVSGPAPQWGTPCELRLRQGPAGFRPLRAQIGSQRLPAHEDEGQWRFPGFLLLPGMEKIRRRGRLEGLLEGRRVVIPAFARLGHASIGAAVRFPSGWSPVRPEKPFNRSAAGEGRLWISFPSSDPDTSWIVFEGPRPVAGYRAGGLALKTALLGFGEKLFVSPRRFNLTLESTLPLSDRVLDSGAIADSCVSGSTVTLTLASPVMWTEEHKAITWASDGCRDIGPPDDQEATTEWRFPGSAEGADGIAIFYGGAWLGTATLAPNPKVATMTFVRGAGSWPETLLFAIDTKLPLLADDVSEEIIARIQSDGGRAGITLCSGSINSARGYVVGRLLEAWDPPIDTAEYMVEDFRLKAKIGGAAALRNLISLAPISGVKAIARGCRKLGRRERAAFFQLLLLAVVPEDVRSELSLLPVQKTFVEAEDKLLARAVEGAGLDENFLASKSGPGIASLARTTLASGTGADGLHFNLVTAMTFDSVRGWLAVHLLRHVATSMS